ncbi:hypothetical protein BHE74_00048693 [Ensete ventricosum]|nr:hypothetical protein BHE74_00048693 [Ensete ventricosum]RZS20577.1 hypothetical protein BHM03_00053112 [Ensete ventricosum]
MNPGDSLLDHFPLRLLITAPSHHSRTTAALLCHWLPPYLDLQALSFSRPYRLTPVNCEEGLPLLLLASLTFRFAALSSWRGFHSHHLWLPLVFSFTSTPVVAIEGVLARRYTRTHPLLLQLSLIIQQQYQSYATCSEHNCSHIHFIAFVDFSIETLTTARSFSSLITS